MSSARVVLTREELFERVWATPVAVLATQLGVSGPGLAKVCSKLAVPVPPRGYWARKRAGGRVRRPELPQAFRDTPRRHEFIMRADRYAAGLSPIVKEAIQRELTASATISVPEEIEKPHPLVKLSRGLLRRFALRARKELLPSKRCLDVVVSRNHLNRALGIMDALIKALESRGYVVEVTEPDRRPEGYIHPYERSRYKASKTGVHIGGAFLEFALAEEMDTVWPHGLPPRDRDERWKWSFGHSGPGYEHRPSGRLALKITEFTFLNPPKKVWRDRKSRRVEDCLNEFIAGLVELAERHRLWEEQLERERRADEEGERRRQEQERQRKSEKARVDDIERRAALWQKASALDEVVKAIVAANAEHVPHAWLAWARAYAAGVREQALAPPALVAASALEPERLATCPDETA